MSHAVAAMFLLTFFWTTTACAQAGPEAADSLNFRSLLLDSGISEQQLAAFDDWNGNVTAEQASTLSQILFRLSQLDMGELRAEPALFNRSHKPGELVQVEGIAIATKTQALPADAPAVLAESGLKVCQVKLDSGESLLVLTPRIPKGWSERPLEMPLDAPIRLRGVILDASAKAGKARALVLASRLEWYPTSNVPSGVAWLAARGFDAALLDDVRQNRGFTRPHESREAEAFYTVLIMLADHGRKELTKRAREAVTAASDYWQTAGRSAAEEAKSINDNISTGTSDDRQRLEQELAKLRRREAIAAHALERAQRGLSSVWPMFLDPEWSKGRFFIVEGTARRAVRIVIDEDSPGGATHGLWEPATWRRGPKLRQLREYYELDLFTPDSQNQPVICCVSRLPAGFPTGDLIREPVRVAGVFFKRWTYARRPSADSSTEEKLPERLSAPLLLAAEPEWLPKPELAARNGWEPWAGIGVAGALAILCFVLARVARRDRLARQRQARYDAPEPLVEP